MILTAERSVLDYEKLLLEAYEYALVQIKKELEAFFQKYARENKIPYAEVRKRLNEAEKKDFHSLLREWYKVAQENGMSAEYKDYLKQLGKRVYITRLESLEASIRFQIEKLKSGQYEWMTDLMNINYIVSYYSSYYSVAQGLEVSVNFATVDRLGIEKAIKERWDGRNYNDTIWTDKDRLLKSISTILPQSFSRGLNSRDLGDMIAKELGVSKNRARTLARTEINHLCNQAALDTYKMCGVEMYQFLATLDMRTSDICRGMDGTIHKVSQAKTGTNLPPLHPNCRSTTIPYFEDEQDIDRIAKDDEGNNIKVPRRMSQKEWVSKYAPEGDRERIIKFLDKFVIPE